METRNLGSQGLQVGAIGLGCMGLSEFYPPAADPAAAVRLIRHALERGVTLFDTADGYGFGANERLLGEALQGQRDRAVVATKCGVLRKPDQADYRGVSNQPAYLKAACEASLSRLGLEVIDLFIVHRRDPEVAIEETVGALAELVREGKVRFIGLSEISSRTLRRAHQVHPISVVQSEYSLLSRDLETDLLAVLRELNVGLVACCPLGRGLLADTFANPEQLPADDLRRTLPRFAPQNFAHNFALCAELRQLAARINRPAAQLALAWLLGQGADVVPIPGARDEAELEQNLAAAELRLNAEQLAALGRMVAADAVAGDRYPDMALIDR